MSAVANRPEGKKKSDYYGAYSCERCGAQTFRPADGPATLETVSSQVGEQGTWASYELRCKRCGHLSTYTWSD